MEDHLSRDRLFLSESSSSQLPGLGDLAVYGTLRAIVGLPVHDAILGVGATTAANQHYHLPAIAAWYERMNRLVPSYRVN
jgi:hypothetical protein